MASTLKVDYIDTNLQSKITFNKGISVPDAVNSDEPLTKGQLLTEIKAVDGAGSGIDADTLDGLQMSQIKGIGFKNRIINGDFSVWQRGTSFIGGTSGYKADRWVCNLQTGSTFDVTQQIDAITGEKSLRCTVSTAEDFSALSEAFLIIQQKFENQFMDFTKSDFTLSFEVKSNVTGTFTVNFNQYTDNGLTDNRANFASEFTITQPDVFQKVVITIPRLTIANRDSTIADNLMDCTLTFVLDVSPDIVGTTIADTWTDANTGEARNTIMVTNNNAFCNTVGNYFEIRKVQLEEGNVATEFEYVPYDIQLMRCQRYYEVINNAIAQLGIPANIRWSMTLKHTEKRTTPTLSYIILFADGSFTTSTTFTWIITSTNAIVLAFTTDSSDRNGTITTTIYLDAEL